MAPAPAWSSSLDLPSLSQSPRVASPSLLSLQTRVASPSLLTLFDLPRAAAWSSTSPSRPPSSSLAREEELGAKLANIHRRSRKRSEHSPNLPSLVPGIMQVYTHELEKSPDPILIHRTKDILSSVCLLNLKGRLVGHETKAAMSFHLQKKYCQRGPSKEIP